MSVILFKKGTGNAKKFDEYLFMSSLDNGWCLTKDEALKPEEAYAGLVEEGPVETEQVEIVAEKPAKKTRKKRVKKVK